MTPLSLSWPPVPSPPPFRSRLLPVPVPAAFPCPRVRCPGRCPRPHPRPLPASALSRRCPRVSPCVPRAMSGRAVRLLRLGAVPYAEALRVQERCVAAARAARGPAALPVPAAARGGPEEPPAESVVLSEPAQPVYTWGLRGAPGAAAAAALRARGAALVAARRGGHITFHGPGQLLAFPVLDLRRRRLPLRAYVAGLEALVLRLCRRLGLGTARALPPPYTGVWMGDSKLCAIGHPWCRC
ncbi:putative lipoyltransferase 2, mitochondrial isoform X2 [Haemorhous mexicanus]|uniref:putative lipoyltransferase 2, mitochondrial isoform X2 n=1 Tax=Haemorhous mexicanus TaxID=30427 RepID=UPI0028BDA729|nr:putative lipoyltransferase 2, mitochondrial isoform X2 [Haemorhous mexicanus]